MVLIVKSSTESCPVRPTRGTMLVERLGTGGFKRHESGLLLPDAIAEQFQLVRIVALGSDPAIMGTTETREWDYAVGEVLMMVENAQLAWLPLEWGGRKLAIISLAHVYAIWTGEVPE